VEYLLRAWPITHTAHTEADVSPIAQAVHVPAAGVTLEGDLEVPDAARGIVLFAHGSGSSRHSPRNRQVAAGLRQAGLGTLLVDLLTAAEEQVDNRTREYRFDIPMLAERLAAATDWLKAQPETADLAIGCFGASTGGGAALVAAAERPDAIAAVVSRGGRPDLAGAALPRVRAPTLLIVGALDTEVIALNRRAMAAMHGSVTLEIVPGATHLFEEPGTLGMVTKLAAQFFAEHLGTTG
jgi:putative phosphoribosyl transferase